MSESSMLAVLKFAIAFDERLDSESRSPDGDDYNVVMNLVRAAIAEASVPVTDPAAAAELARLNVLMTDYEGAQRKGR